jgi:hypothetical protein
MNRAELLEKISRELALLTHQTQHDLSQNKEEPWFEHRLRPPS